jgi:hypothetical protein
MPRYHFSCAFVYDGTPDAIHLGLTRWVQDLGHDVAITLKSSLTDGIPPVEFFRQKLGAFSEESIWLRFDLRSSGGTGRGTLDIARPSETRAPSRLELQFSINAKSRGVFASGEDVRHALVSAASAFGGEGGQVEADDFSDEESSRKYAVFQSLRDRRVPVNFEWANVFRAETFRSIGWDLAQLAAVPGVRFGEERGFVWILLSETPFSYKASAGTDAQRRVEETLDLRAKQQMR